MTTKNLSLGVLGLAFATLFILRDALAQDCPNLDNGCIAATVAPCSATGTCVDTTTQSVPGGGTCDDSSTVYVWSATTPPTAWQDCIPRSGFGPCPRYSSVCQTITFYRGATTCARGVSCGSNDISGCTNGSPATVCPVLGG